MDSTDNQFAILEPVKAGQYLRGFILENSLNFRLFRLMG